MLNYRAGANPVHTFTSPPPTPNIQISALQELKNEYEVIIIGAGAAGGIVAAVLAEAGKEVLLLERGRWQAYADILGDHLRHHRLALYGHNTGPDLVGNPREVINPQGESRILAPHQGGYQNNAMSVGGGTRVYGAQAWRFCLRIFVWPAPMVGQRRVLWLIGPLVMRIWLLIMSEQNGKLGWLAGLTPNFTPAPAGETSPCRLCHPALAQTNCGRGQKSLIFRLARRLCSSTPSPIMDDQFVYSVACA